ncbi:putative ankyrin repeat protein RF_0381 [Branchiostoma lanceolatum]|uniref:putative ankyrin repeat protein RF_0381 n=1 Tax=Branchiostoma lanceolatum TaxID=7740 RepID=UPI003453FEBB
MNVTDLFSAASNGDCNKIRSLLDEGMDVGAKDGDGFTALHHATKAGHCPAMELLLDQGADIDVDGRHGREPGKTGLTALHLAAMNSDCAAIALLLDRGANLEPRNMYYQTALHFAASRGDCDHVGLLLEWSMGCGTLEVRRQLSAGLQQSSLSTEGGRCDAIALLLDRGADIAALDDAGNTPLHYAAMEGNNKAILLLLDRGADLYKENEFGHFLLHMAAFGGHNNTVNLLLDRGMDVNITIDHASTALYIAAQYGHHETFRLLCSRGADLGIKDESDIGEMTPLLEAAENGHCNVIDVALTFGATLAERNSTGSTALHLAVQYGGLDTVTHLLSLPGVQVNARDSQGETSLHEVVKWTRCHQVEMTEALLMAGADCSIKDVDDQTPSDLAPKGTDIHKSLLYHQKHYPNLKRACRAKILSILGKTRQEEICQFGIPQELKDFLLFKSIN